MSNDPKDRHVVAAAVKAGAQVITTSNIKDFSPLPDGIEAQLPDDFLCHLFDLDPDVWIPINSELLVYLKRAIAASSSELVLPAEDGSMLPRHTKVEEVLRRAMRRAGLVTGYVHKCRRHGCGHREAACDANLRCCSKCKFKLFPVGEVRQIRFHHLRHTTASLLLMSGADLAAGAANHASPGSAPHDRGLRTPVAELPEEGNRASQLRSCGRRRDQKQCLGGRRIGAAAARRITR